MSSLETEERTHYEIIDRNIAAGYVTYIVDLWDGDRHDPAVGITRYIGVFHGHELEREDGEAFDPYFSQKASSWSYKRRPKKPAPVVWEELEEVKEADRQAESYKNQQENLMQTEYMGYGEARTRKELYQAFMLAVDILVADPDNEAAWAAVDAYRNYQAGLHEK